MKKRNRLILEFTEFNLNRMNPDSVNYPMPNVDNPQLSINAFDKHQDAIRMGIARINSILQTLSNSTSFKQLKSNLTLEDQNIQSMRVLRIVKSNNINYDVYISFNVADKEYWGQIKNILDKNPSFTSEIFKDYDLVQSKEWVIKIKGLIIKAVKEWLNPEKGNYKLLNDEAFCFSVETGRLLKLEKNTEVEVIRSFENKILIKYSNDYYHMVGDNYIYFNWWFKRLE
jgi:hypothetical protein